MAAYFTLLFGLLCIGLAMDYVQTQHAGETEYEGKRGRGGRKGHGGHGGGQGPTAVQTTTMGGEVEFEMEEMVSTTAPAPTTKKPKPKTKKQKPKPKPKPTTLAPTTAAPTPAPTTAAPKPAPTTAPVYVASGVGGKPAVDVHVVAKTTQAPTAAPTPARHSNYRHQPHSCPKMDIATWENEVVIYDNLNCAIIIRMNPKLRRPTVTFQAPYW